MNGSGDAHAGLRSAFRAAPCHKENRCHRGKRLWFPRVFEGFKRRRERRQQQHNDLELRRAYLEGYEARTDGQPCAAPAGYDIEFGFGLVGEWIAGWTRADRDLGGDDPAPESA